MRKKLKAVIIEDMLLAREALKRDLADHCPEVELLGMAEGVVSGAKLIGKYDPDIIFLDIHLKDGDGFDLLDIISDHKGKVIFTTASDQHAIKAFRFSAVDYLMKPLQVEQLKQSVRRIINSHNQGKEQFDMLREQIYEQNTPVKIALHTQEKIVIATIDEIIRCQSSSNYTQFYFGDGTKLLVTKTLKDYELMFYELGFIRVHQSHLVNIAHVKAFIKQDGGYLKMSDDALIPVSYRKRNEVLKAIEAL